MIDPTTIDLSALPWIPLDSTAGFPKRSGIYFAIDSQGQVQYIGLSKNARGRWKNHHRYAELEAIGGVRIAYLFVDDVALLPSVESTLIQWFNPLLNVRGKAKKARRIAGQVSRRLATYRMDRRSLSALATLAARSGVEPQRYLENYFFARGKELGLIPPDAAPLGETRGGKREGAGETQTK